MTAIITNLYEQPLNERVRLLLRLEQVFAQAIEYKSVSDQYQTQMCLNALFALLNLTNRYELRAEILKELERIKNLLINVKKSEQASIDITDEVLLELSQCTAALHDIKSKQIDRIRNIEFLNIIKQRNIHDTGSYLFELPELQYWLLQSAGHRAKQVQVWLDDFMPFRRAILFLLRLIRESSIPSQECAENGMFLKTIDNRMINYQLLRVEVLSSFNAFPRISGGKHRFAIRFMEQIQADERPVQTDKNVKFGLQTCII